MADQLVWTLSVAEGVPAGELGHCSPETAAPFHVLTWTGGRGPGAPSLPSALHGTFAFLTISVYFWVLLHITHCTVLFFYSISFLCGTERLNWYQSPTILWCRKSTCMIPCGGKTGKDTFCPHLCRLSSTQILVGLCWKQMPLWLFLKQS